MIKDLNIYPAIDILNEKCVRLFQGDYQQETVYNFDPFFVAKKWVSLGAKYLHVVDLNGARDGTPVNFDIIKRICSLGVPVQVGGGIRDYRTAKGMLENGVSRIILGTAALRDLEFTKKILERKGDQVAVGMDCREGKLAIEGWKKTTQIKAIDFAKELKKQGLKLVIYTDIERDGTLKGPNFNELKEFSEATKIPTIASGGISSILDVQMLDQLRDMGSPLEGVIVGKALYTGNVKLEELLLALARK